MQTPISWMVKTQKECGTFYQNFALKLLEPPDCVGLHWFKCQDKENSNRGVVDHEFNAYTVVLERMPEINQQAYSLRHHFQSEDKGNQR